MVCAQETKHRTLSHGYWFTPRVAYELHDSSSVFLEGNTRFHGVQNQERKGIAQYLYRSYLELGYEHCFSDQIQLGASGKFIQLANDQEWFYKAYFQHLGRFLKHDFNTRIFVEYIREVADDNASTVEADIGRWSVELELRKRFESGLGYALQFRPFQYFNIENQNYTSFKDRFFDRSRTTVELLYWPKEQWYFSFFYMKETEYYYVSAQSPEHKLNQHRFIFGARLIYRIIHDYN